MSFRFDADENLADAVRRVATEQADEAVDDLQDLDELNPVPAIHDCRKRCKKIRGLVRLVRPALGEQYAAANQDFRDAARALSASRDAHALLDTFDRLSAVAADQLPVEGLGGVREELVRRRRRATESIDDADERVETARHLLQTGRDRIGGWTLDPDGWSVVTGGLRKTYGRGAAALRTAIDHPTAQNCHELRKRAKYTWYHVRLLADAAPSVLTPMARDFHAVSDGLGDAHDLDVLHARINEAPDSFGGADVVAAASVLFSGHRSLLVQRSIELAARLYVERPKRFADRLAGYGRQWRLLGDQQPVGEMEDVFAGAAGAA